MGRRRIARQLQAQERREKVWALKRSGASYEQISKQVGVSAVQCFRDVREEIAKRHAQLTETIQEQVAIDLARLEHMILHLMPKIQQGDPEAMRTAVRVMERKARMLGIDAPERHEHTGKDGEALPPAVQNTLVLAALPDDQLKERLRTLVARLNAPPALPEAEVIDVQKPTDPEQAYEAVLAKRNGTGKV